MLKVSAAPPKNRKFEVTFFCLICLLKLIDSSPLAALSRPDGLCLFRTENRGGSQKLVLKVSATPPKNRKSELTFFCLIRLLKLIDSSPLAALSRPDGFCPFRTENRGGSQKLFLKVSGPGDSQEQLFKSFGEHPPQVLLSSGLAPPKTSFCNVSKAAQENVLKVSGALKTSSSEFRAAGSQN